MLLCLNLIWILQVYVGKEVASFLPLELNTKHQKIFRISFKTLYQLMSIIQMKKFSLI